MIVLFSFSLLCTQVVKFKKNLGSHSLLHMNMLALLMFVVVYSYNNMHPSVLREGETLTNERIKENFRKLE